MKKLIFTVALFICGMLAYKSNAQTLQYWDDNGTLPATDGTWDTTTTNWTGSATLGASTVPFTNGNFAIFAAGSTTIPTLNINVPGTVSCEGLGDGTTSTGGASGAAVNSLNFIGGGSIGLPTGAWSFECGGSANNIIINVPVTGSGGIVQHNSGSLYLYGNNTYTGGTSVTGGQIIYYNNNNSFGTGAISTSGGGTSFWCTNGPGDIITLANAFSVGSGTTVINFVNGNTICTGPWTLGASLQLKNSSAATTNLTVSGAISGAFGLTLGTPNSGTIILSGANTYSGPTLIGLSGATATVSLSSINSVSTPAQQANSSLGKPSSAANGTIEFGTGGYAGDLIYTGNGETSDRVIDLIGTTGGATIEMDGNVNPLVLTANFNTTNTSSRTLTLQGSSTLANTIFGIITNSGSSGKISLTKAGVGSWALGGKDTFTGNLAINGGTLTIAGSGYLGGGSYAGTISDASGATFAYDSSSGETLSGTISGSGAFDVAATAAASVTISGTANTFSGLFTVTSGTLSINADGSLGTAPGSFLANDITLNGGPGANLRANANNITINANRGITLGANGGAIQVAGNDTCTYNGVISGAGQFQVGVNASTGLGVLALGGVEIYTNMTDIAAGTLRLSANASLGNSAGILMSNSPTLDVSAQNPFDLSTTNTFTSIESSNTAAPGIIGASGGDVSFGAQTVNLSFFPLSTNGDPAHAALSVTQGTLELNGNTVNVTNTSALTLDVGYYTLIQSSNGISVTSPLTLNYFGPAMAPNTTASLVVFGNTLALQVAPASGYTGTLFTNQSPSQTFVYGTATANFSGTVTAAGSYPSMNETVNVAIGTVVTNIATISDSTGDFTLNNVPINTLPAGTYVITYSYPGTNSTLAPANDTSTELTITKAALTVTANAQAKTYGQTIPVGAGSTAFIASGLQNSETIGSVSLAISGSPSGAVTNAPVSGSPYTITPSAATGGTFNAANYNITYVTASLTVNPLPVGLTGTRLYDGTASAVFSILSITNKAVGTDVVNIASGSVTLASPGPGSVPIISASGLTLGGAQAGNYTTIGATGAVNVTINANSTNIVSTAANNSLTLSWPLDHTGWTLQAQTNDVTVGLSTNWVDVAGSSATNQVVVPVDPNNGTVFYRLYYAP